MFKALFLLIIFVIVLGGGYLFFSGLINDDGPAPDTTLQRSPDVAVEEFYEWYLEFKGQALTSGAYQDSPFLTKGYKDRLANAASSYENLLHDPILCSLDKPYETSVENVDIKEDGMNSEVIFLQDYYGNPVRTKVSVVKQGNYWYIDGIECVVEEKPEVDLDRQVIIYFFNPGRDPRRINKKLEDTFIGEVYGVARMLDNGEDRFEGAIKRLFRGPTQIEQSQGFTSVLGRGMLRNFFVVGDVAFIDLDASIMEDLANIPKEIDQARLQINETLMHTKEIKDTVFAIDGDPVKFYEWALIDCPTEDTETDIDYCNPQPFKLFGVDEDIEEVADSVPSENLEIEVPATVPAETQ
jgi:hypothetical protein